MYKKLIKFVSILMVITISITGICNDAFASPQRQNNYNMHRPPYSDRNRYERPRPYYHRPYYHRPYYRRPYYRHHHYNNDSDVMLGVILGTILGTVIANNNQN